MIIVFVYRGSRRDRKKDMYQYIYRTWKWSQSDEKCCTVIVIVGLTWLDKQTKGEGQATRDQPPTLPLEKEGPGYMQHGTRYGKER